jgi:hypothetical protein
MSRNGSPKGRRMSRGRTRVGALAVLLACAVAGTLMIEAGVASAASRGFFIFNHSKHALRVENATNIPRDPACDKGLNSVFCQLHYGAAFEGRPRIGAVLQPNGEPQDWELKYYFVWPHYCSYGAELKYKIEGTSHTLVIKIMTCNFENFSHCALVNQCTAQPFAGGRKIVFHNP